MKKKMFLACLLVLGVFALNISQVDARAITACNQVFGNNVQIEESIPKIISTIIKVIKIAVPILLIVLGMIDLLKGLTAGKDDEIKKGTGIFVKRIIAAVLVFFVFAIVQFIISLVASAEWSKMSDCVNCFINFEGCK